MFKGSRGYIFHKQFDYFKERDRIVNKTHMKYMVKTSTRLTQVMNMVLTWDRAITHVTNL
jgi:hypothetical protein